MTASPASPLPDRASDDDRARAAAVLTDAAGAGLLGLPEVDHRLAAAYAARTTADLEAVLAELPASWLAAHSRAKAAEQHRHQARQALRGHLLAYLAGMALMVGIWLAVALSAGAWYPWPIWPALGWGIGVWSHVRAARSSGPGRATCGARRPAAGARGSSAA